MFFENVWEPWLIANHAGSHSFVMVYKRLFVF